LLGFGDDDAASSSSFAHPSWVDANELEREPPEVVLVFEGSQRAQGSADLAAAGVVGAVRRALSGGGNGSVGNASSSSSVTAPHAGLYGDDGGDDTAALSIGARFMSALAEAKRDGKPKASGRHFVAGRCDDEWVTGILGREGAIFLREGDELAGFMRQRSDRGDGDAPDVVVVCASPSAIDGGGEEDQPLPEDERLAMLGEEVDKFASFVEGLRAHGVRHAAMYTAIGVGAPARPIDRELTCRGDMAAKASRRTAGTAGGRALLFTSTSSPPPTPAPPPAPKYVCDDLCKLQTNIVSGLIFFWTVLFTILFGYALMHNLDTPSRFEKSKEETDR
jgi:hypothetical protein